MMGIPTEAPTQGEGRPRARLPRIPGADAIRLRFFSSAKHAPRARRPTDAVLLLFSLFVVGVSELVRNADPELARTFEAFVRSLPGLFGGAWEVAYRLVTVWALLLVLATVLRGRFRLLGDQAMATLVATAGAWALLPGDTALGDALTTAGPPSVYPAALLALVAAVLVTTSPHLVKPARRTGRVLLTISSFAALALGIASIGGVMTGFAVGAGAAALIHLIVGSPGGRPTPEDTAEALAALGVPTNTVQEARLHRRGVALMQGRAVDGRGLLVKVYGRDAWDGQLLAGAWAYLWYRDERMPLSLSRLQLVEHEAFLTLLAERAGAPVLPVVAAGMAGSDAVLALQQEGLALSDNTVEISDRSLQDLWLGVAAMHGTGIAHGALEADRLVLEPDATIRITDFSVATAASSQLDMLADRAQLLVTTALAVGAERAIATAVAALGHDGLTDALPYIQPAAMSAATRRQLKATDTDLDTLRARAAEVVGAEAPDLVPLRRVTTGSIVTLVLLLVAGWAVISAVSGVGISGIVDELRSGDTTLLLIALALSPSIQIAEAISTLGAVLRPMRFGAILLLQFAIRFISLAVPSSAARIAMNVRFFQRSGLTAATALAVGAIDSLAGFVVQIVLLIAIVAFGLIAFETPVAGSTSFTPDGTILLIGAVVLAIAVVLVLVVPRLRKLVVPKLKELLAAGRVLRRPGKVFQLFGGNLVSQVIQAGLLGLCLRAFGETGTLAEMLFVNTLTSLFAGIVPVPGGIGVYEATLTALLVGLGIPETTALATAVAFRVITFYLPPLWGVAAMRKLRRDGNL